MENVEIMVCIQGAAPGMICDIIYIYKHKKGERLC